MYTNNRDAYRQAFFTTWQKHIKKQPLEAAESQLVEIMLQHPEYHALLENPTAYQHQAFTLEENPFFHMSLHLALREQIRTNRPAGITHCYQQLLLRYPCAQEAEHRMMRCLAQILWQAQESGDLPSEEGYLASLQQL